MFHSIGIGRINMVVPQKMQQTVNDQVCCVVRQRLSGNMCLAFACFECDRDVSKRDLAEKIRFWIEEAERLEHRRTNLRWAN